MRLLKLSAAALMAAALSISFAVAEDKGQSTPADAERPPKTYAPGLDLKVPEKDPKMSSQCEWNCWRRSLDCTSAGGDAYTCDQVYQSCKSWCGP